MPVALRAMMGAAGFDAGSGGPDGTQYYVEVTIASSEVASTLTDFPVYVDLSDLPAAFFTNVQSDGGDIRVTESDGTTRCPVELVSIDTGASTGELHFLASSVSSSSDTTFRIYYGATSTLSQPGVATTYGRNAVWSDYVGVWHGDSGADSTGVSDLTAYGNATTGSGKLGNALSFDGSGDAWGVGDNATLSVTGDYTLQAWVLTNTLLSGNRNILAKFDYAGGDREYMLRVTSDEKLNTVFSQDGTSIKIVDVPGSTALATATWYAAHVTHDVSAGGSGGSVYRNGSDDTGAATKNSATSVSNGASDLLVGANGTTASPNESWDGLVDEIRVRKSVLSADWIGDYFFNDNSTT